MDKHNKTSANIQRLIKKKIKKHKLFFTNTSFPWLGLQEKIREAVNILQIALKMEEFLNQMMMQAKGSVQSSSNRKTHGG